jgi:hypothetical protein
MKNAVAEIGYTHSHQSVLIRHLSEAIHLFGLKVTMPYSIAATSVNCGLLRYTC